MIAPMSTGRCFWKRVLFTALTVALTGQTALAAEGNDGTWFDPQNPDARAGAGTAPAAAPPPPANPADEHPSLPPSPLLQDRGGANAAAADTAADSEDRDPRALSEFRPTLDPYGSWVQHPTYGTVWVPNANVVGSEFTPYVSAGHWGLDEGENWVWVSDYPFGSVVFHYGRWVWIGGAGWAWVPGYRYAPAWVSWRVPTSSYAYVGWAPLGPSFIWYNGYASAYWYGVPTPWIYCSSYYVFHPHVHYYVVQDRTLVGRLNANTRVYVPASRVGVRQASTLSGPPLSAARVPAAAVPNQRVRATPLRSAFASRTATSPFSRANGGREPAGSRFASSGVASGARPDRFRPPASAPAPGSRSRLGSGRFEVTPTRPQTFRPPSTPPAPSASSQRFAPSPSTPRLAPSPMSPRLAPSGGTQRFTPRYSPSPSTPRVAPSRSYPSPSRSYSPSPSRSFSPSPSRSFSPSPSRSFSPSPSRSFSPGGGGFHPGGGGSHPRGGRR
jgi:hypothetical protein